MLNKKEIISSSDNNQLKKIKYDDNSTIFQFINPNSNDKLSEMSGFDLQDLLILIDDYYLELRNTLGFNQYVTFGLELEFENAARNRIEAELGRVFYDNSWIIKGDSSLINGAEINSPILSDNPNNWKNLKTVCSIIEKYASIGKNSAGHIHVGTQVLGNKKESWLNFIKLWSVYENVIFRFAYGDFLTARPNIQHYAEPMTKYFWNDYEKLSQNGSNLSEIIFSITHGKYMAVNFNKTNNYNSFAANNTIEFRCPNGSLEPVIWQNNVNLFVNILEYSKTNSFNDDLVQKRRIENSNKFSSLDWYNEIYIQQALELCDMAFTNNFDKIYFLRQYLKSFQIGVKELDKPRQFIKNQ